MCGIAGIVDFKAGIISEAQLKAMCDSMVHRGPDEAGYYLDNGPDVSVSLGHRRLSIIDLKTGRQPIYNETKDICIVTNGEIYNFIELKNRLEARGHVFYTRSDAEVIVHAYEEYQDDVVRHLDGMFAFALWDQRKRRLVLARDRIGKKPLLYSVLGSKIVFASEFSALLANPDITREIDYEAIHHYLTYLCIPAPLTAFKNIRKLPAAHIMIFADGHLSLKRYWRLDFSRKIKIGEAEAVEQIGNLLKESVKKRLVSDVPLGMLLSGGVDSSYITALTARLKPNGLDTFSVGFNESFFNESPYARFAADYLGTTHHEDYITPNALEVLPELVQRYGEPFGDSSALPTYYVCRTAAKKVKVALNGDGGDEAFGGYRRHLANYLAETCGPAAKIINRSPLKLFFDFFPERPSSPNSPGSVRRFLSAAELDRPQRYMGWIGFFKEDSKRGLYTDEFVRRARGLDSVIFMEEVFKDTAGLDAVDAALYTDISFGLQNDLAVKMDIASMANSVETRSPLLDYKLLEFSASLPSSFKIRGFSLKYIFKKAAKGMLPDKILKRPKRGFAVPVDEWFRGPLKDYLVDTVLSEKAQKRGYFNTQKIRGLVGNHSSGKANYGHHLWGLLMLELWHKRFIDGKDSG
jgi:asparagine synthase (glutamine-hydrolysing)